MNNPVNIHLNAAIQGFVARLFPVGFDVAAEAPQSLEDLNAQLEHGRMVVWEGASGQTIYDDAEINYGFRAWHDWAHWRHQLAFNAEGERAAAYVQVAHLARIYGDGSEVVDMAALVLAEVVGQAAHFAAVGEYPVDQRAFDIVAAEALRPLAERLVRRFAEAKSDGVAIRVARADHQRQLQKMRIAA